MGSIWVVLATVWISTTPISDSKEAYLLHGKGQIITDAKTKSECNQFLSNVKLKADQEVKHEPGKFELKMICLEKPVKTPVKNNPLRGKGREYSAVYK
jgi:hypothetical protein